MNPFLLVLLGQMAPTVAILWILAAGTWNDAGVWDDTAAWNDGAVGPLVYVDNAATGANNGSSWGDAWESFSDINWGAIVPGTTIYISGGATSKTYAGPGMVVGASGTAGAPITISRGTDAGHNGIPIIDGLNGATTWYGVNNSGFTSTPQNYIKISRLRLQHFASAGLYFNTTVGCVLEDNDIVTGTVTTDAPRAILLQNNNSIVVRANRITHQGVTPGQTDGIYSQNNNEFIYENNDIDATNTDDTEHSDCIQSHLDRSGVIRNNILRTPPAGFANKGIWVHAVLNGETIAIYNNIVMVRGGQFGIGYWREDDAQPHGTVLAYNNTIYGGARCLTMERVANFVIKNNILAFPDPGWFAYWSNILTPAAIDVTTNLVWAPGAVIAQIAGVDRTWTQWTATDGYNASGVNADPLFVDAAGGDFTLQAESPAIDAGTTLAQVTTDIDSNGRPQGAAYDIGAYEVATASFTADSTSITSDDTTLTADAI